jgi:adenylosuccinate lyase
MRKSRSETDHLRYIRNREEILARQKVYRETHKEEIKTRRRQRDFIKKYIENPKPKPKTRKELDHAYYIRHREEIIAKSIARRQKQKEL